LGLWQGMWMCVCTLGCRFWPATNFIVIFFCVLWLSKIMLISILKDPHFLYKIQRGNCNLGGTTQSPMLAWAWHD
jgi:hypothetical protein